jgi:hypothetical protein
MSETEFYSPGTTPNITGFFAGTTRLLLGAVYGLG